MSVALYVDRFWISPYAYTTFVALREKGVPFEVREVSLGSGEQRTPAYRDLSVTARVPALEHDGFGLAESQAIVEYVDEVFDGPRLLPAGVRERARVRQVMSWLRSDLAALREDRPSQTLFYTRTSVPLTEAGRAAADKLVRTAEQLVAPGAATLASTWSPADADLAFMLQRLVLNGDPVPERLREYAAAQWARPSVREFVEHARVPFQKYW